VQYAARATPSARLVFATQLPVCAPVSTVRSSRSAYASRIATVSSVDPSSTAMTSTPSSASLTTLSRAARRWAAPLYTGISTDSQVIGGAGRAG
jgi:hypothetical protein